MTEHGLASHREASKLKIDSEEANVCIWVTTELVNLQNRADMVVVPVWDGPSSSRTED